MAEVHVPQLDEHTSTTPLPWRPLPGRRGHRPLLRVPRLRTTYDALLPQIDRAVGDSVDEKAAPR